MPNDTTKIHSSWTIDAGPPQQTVELVTDCQGAWSQAKQDLHDRSVAQAKALLPPVPGFPEPEWQSFHPRGES